MIRRAASKVPLLHNKLQSVPYYNVAKLKLSIINHYRQLTDLQKMKVGRAFPCLEINIGQTLRHFLELLITIIQALKRLGCEPSDQMQKIYIFTSILLGIREQIYCRNPEFYI